MLKLFFRLLGLSSLALAVVTAILDLTRSIADSTVVMTALGEQWASLHTTSLQFFQVGVQRKLGIPSVWDLVIVPVLQMPGWLVFGVLAIVFLWLGRGRERGLNKRRGS